MRDYLATAFTLALLGCGRTQYYGASSSHINSPVSHESQAYVSSEAAQRAQDCERGVALSCEVSAIAYENGDPGNNIPKDGSIALKYHIKACLLGSGSSCHAAGEAYLKGSGTPADQSAAVSYFSTSCEAEKSVDNPMSGFSCWELASILLKQNYWTNYDRAMALLDRACLLRSALCDAKEPFEGTHREAEGKPPRGAMDFVFGMPPKELYEVCKSHKGSPGSGPFPNEVLCRSPFLGILQRQTQYIALSLCDGKLCAITISFETTKNRHFNELFEFKKKLHDLYGSPTLISQKFSETCRNDDTLASLAECLRTDGANFYTLWLWTDRASVSLALTSDPSGGIALQILYKNAEAIKALESSGL